MLLLQAETLSMPYAEKGADAASAFRFVPGIDAVRPEDNAFDGLDTVG